MTGAKEIKMTGVIELTIEDASAKISSSPPDDEIEDYKIPIWAGVLPITTKTEKLKRDKKLMRGINPSQDMLALQNKKL